MLLLTGSTTSGPFVSKPAREMATESPYPKAYPKLVDHYDADASPAERRRGLRIEQNRPIKVLEPAGSRYFGGQTRDISSTGLQIELPLHAPIGVGETLNIHVGLNQSGESLANRKQMIPARVVWVKRPPTLRKGTITLGVEFLASISAQLDGAQAAA